ncbi:hypothetical protein BJX76DRAFT_343986 [Aspergillus varians]
MPRPPIDLEPYQEEIINLYRAGTSPESIAKLLGNQYSIQVASRMIKARLSKWNIWKQNHTASTNKVLHAWIKVLMYQVGLNKDEILYVLQSEGFNIQAYTLKYV